MKTKKSIARENVLKFLFSKQFCSDLIFDDFLKNFGFSRKGINHAEKILNLNTTEIDSRISSILKKRSIESISSIEHILIKISLIEDLIGTPKKVNINEILTLSEKYADTLSYSLINKVLDEEI